MPREASPPSHARQENLMGLGLGKEEEIVSTLRINGHTLERHTDMVEVTSLEEPDMTWRYTDRNGHVHKWEFSHDIPTIRLVVDAEETDEYPALVHYECCKCQEYITPGMRSVSTKRYIPGTAYYTIDGEAALKEEFDALMAQVTKKEEGPVMTDNNQSPSDQEHANRISKAVSVLNGCPSDATANGLVVDIHTFDVRTINDSSPVYLVDAIVSRVVKYSHGG